MTFLLNNWKISEFCKKIPPFLILKICCQKRRSSWIRKDLVKSVDLVLHPDKRVLTAQM